jgi:hypothetical protein
MTPINTDTARRSVRVCNDIVTGIISENVVREFSDPNHQYASALSVVKFFSV